MTLFDSSGRQPTVDLTPGRLSGLLIKCVLPSNCIISVDIPVTSISFPDTLNFVNNLVLTLRADYKNGPSKLFTIVLKVQ